MWTCWYTQKGLADAQWISFSLKISHAICCVWYAASWFNMSVMSCKNVTSWNLWRAVVRELRMYRYWDFYEDFSIKFNKNTNIQISRFKRPNYFSPQTSINYTVHKFSPQQQIIHIRTNKHSSQIQNIHQNTVPNPPENSVFGSRSGLVLSKGDVTNLHPGSNTSYPKLVYEGTSN